MSQKMRQRPLAERFDHLVDVISSERFLHMKGLNNDLPFYICDYAPSEENDIQRIQRHLVSKLSSLDLSHIGGRGVKVLEVNLYDLSIEILKNREGSDEGVSLWDQILASEPYYDKDGLLELLQNVLDPNEHLIPTVAKLLASDDFDVLFISGVGEVFPYIRSHNVLNNLQSTAKNKPTVMFFPGDYVHSPLHGTSLELFGRLHDDRYYRAFNIYETQA